MGAGLLVTPVFAGKAARIRVTIAGGEQANAKPLVLDQFCGLALIETKNRALELIKSLEAELEIPALVRIHVTGCPNSCGQAQVGDIGLIGAPAKKEVDGKKVAVPGFNIILGGTGLAPVLPSAARRGHDGGSLYRR